MGRFRIELVDDATTGMVMAEAFGPDGAMIANSLPIYHSRDEAEQAIIATIKQAWPDRAPDAVDHSIGV
ncbi:hypothetical protein FSB78_04535 [Sphingomonas ginsenosidivorax]|uniref:Uncharacterized protein n=1 Tax=Sphingomonas ginsenosidivorax TaxID=862135 RepID=A0A5C6UDJ1_9SPHN|nr:hypothetical protein [Sphingomonas ginsenosidivorax]TXC70291.1 hypothetical protein FSB78_04535 [Sphingomonas ginsenosidivorax]